MQVRVEYWITEDVNPDGTIGDPVRPEEGSLNVFAHAKCSREYLGPRTPSIERDGDWLMVTTGRLPDGRVQGITVYFREPEMLDRIRDGGAFLAEVIEADGGG